MLKMDGLRVRVLEFRIYRLHSSLQLHVHRCLGGGESTCMQPAFERMHGRVGLAFLSLRSKTLSPAVVTFKARASSFTSTSLTPVSIVGFSL